VGKHQPVAGIDNDHLVVTPVMESDTERDTQSLVLHLACKCDYLLHSRLYQVHDMWCLLSPGIALGRLDGCHAGNLRWGRTEDRHLGVEAGFVFQCADSTLPIQIAVFAYKSRCVILSLSSFGAVVQQSN